MQVEINGKKMEVKRMKKRPFLLSILVLPLLVLVVWYHGGAEPLTRDEVDYYLSTIKEQKQNPGGKHNLKILRRFLENDDGKPFYTVNLYKYHPLPQYELDSQYLNKYVDQSGRDAFDRFSKVMIKLMASHSSHPIFGSDWVDDGSSNWDRLVIVRYRSRRDIAEIFASDKFAEASEHKWAALADHDRLLVQGLHIPSFYLIGLIMILFIYVFLCVIPSKQRR